MSKIKVILKGKTTTIEADESRTILDNILESGLPYPKGCLAGSCGACSSIVTEGIENLSPPSAVEADTISRVHNDLPQSDIEKLNTGGKLRLCCRAKALGNLTIEPTDCD